MPLLSTPPVLGLARWGSGLRGRKLRRGKCAGAGDRGRGAGQCGRLGPRRHQGPRGRSEAGCRTPEGPGRSDFGVTFSAGVSPRAPKAGLSLPAACGRALEPAPNPARRSLPAPRPAPQRRAPLGLPSARRHLFLRDEPP